jgi:hypothetical protein
MKGMINAEHKAFICTVNFQKKIFSINSLDRKPKTLSLHMLLQWKISVLHMNSEQVCKKSSYEAQCNQEQENKHKVKYGPPHSFRYKNTRMLIYKLNFTIPVINHYYVNTKASQLPNSVQTRDTKGELKPVGFKEVSLSHAATALLRGMHTSRFATKLPPLPTHTNRWGRH